MRPIDATRLVKLVLEERDKIPLTVVERYSFGVPSPNKHGASMRGGIRKVLRLIEQAPTLDYAPVRHGEWIEEEGYNGDDFYRCSACGEYWVTIDGTPAENNMHFCPHCGAKMDGNGDST